MYEVLAHDIQRLGVRQTFGLMSDDTALLIAALDARGVRFRGTRHETNALAMTDGHASVTNAVTIGIIGRGPATANAVLGAVQTLRSGSKVLLIFADSPNHLPQPNALGPEQKAFSPAAVLQAAGFRTFVASDPSAARDVLAKAWRAAHSGSVALLLPMNVQHALVDPNANDPGPVPLIGAVSLPARQAALQAASALLAKSRCPLIVAGIGAHHGGAREAIIRLADHLGAALATTLKAQDMFRGHPANCGILGSFSNAGGRRLIEQADCVLVFGASLNQRTSSFGHALPPDVPLIHVDPVRGNIGRWHPADVALVADARSAAEQLIAELPARPVGEQALRRPDVLQALAGFRLDSEFEPVHTPRTMDPRSLALALDELLPADRNVVYDVGNFMQIAPFVSVPGPSQVKYSLDFASIGLGFGTALGVACAAPERPTVLFIGDGGFLMTMGELETVVREDIPLVIVLMNDCAYGAEVHYLKMREMPTTLARFFDIDFAPVAEAFGFQAATVRTLEALRALAPMLARPEGPIFLDCKVNGAVAAPFLLENAAQEARKH
jgi:thiamine pyrophosphate-dependent acetolactate synthase large subunit-like protein